MGSLSSVQRRLDGWDVSFFHSAGCHWARRNHSAETVAGKKKTCRHSQHNGPAGCLFGTRRSHCHGLQLELALPSRPGREASRIGWDRLV